MSVSHKKLEQAKERGFWAGYGEADGVAVSSCPYVQADKVRAFWAGVALGRATRSKLGADQGIAQIMQERALSGVQASNQAQGIGNQPNGPQKQSMARSRRGLVGSYLRDRVSGK